MEQAKAALAPMRGRPVGGTAGRGDDRRRAPHRGHQTRRPLRAGEVEQHRRRPEANREVGRDRVQGMPDLASVQNVFQAG